jgi:hypothetical protein
MIPNAVANTGPYAGLWGHLKSIDHALGRTLDFGDPRKLTGLDRDRLQALIDLLEGSLPKDPDPLNVTIDFLTRCGTTEPDYSTAIDFHREIAEHPAFKEWLKTSKISFEDKVKRLIKSLEVVLVKSTPSSLFLTKEEIPQKEFQVIRAVLQSLLDETEAALC